MKTDKYKRERQLKNWHNPFIVKYMLIIVTIMACFVMTGCHSSKKSSRQNHKDKIETVRVNPGLRGKEKRLVEEALSWQGTPYRYGGTDKGKGADCSGVVLSVYEKVAGIKLPRNSKKQAEFCKRIKEKQVKAGDLVFFATGKDRNTISHVGIMIDGRQFIHASTKKGVIVSDMDTPYYQRTFKMYGRVPQ